MEFKDLDTSHFGNFTPEESRCFFDWATEQVMGRREENEFIKRAQRDELVRQKRKQLIEESMPKIEGRPEWGPITITADELEKRKKEEVIQKRIEREKAKANILRCISMKRKILRKIAKLNPNKKNYSKKHAELHSNIIDLDEAIRCTCVLHRLKVVEKPKPRNHPIEKAMAYLAKKAKAIKKSVKKFCKRNSDTIEAIAVVAIPVIIAGVIRSFFGVPIDPMTAAGV
jgi:hypothetical protein